MTPCFEVIVLFINDFIMFVCNAKNFTNACVFCFSLSSVSFNRLQKNMLTKKPVISTAPTTATAFIGQTKKVCVTNASEMCYLQCL